MVPRKKMAGSHVIVKTPDGELPDRTFEEAGRLAAYYSKGRTAPKVEIDYIQKKHVKNRQEPNRDLWFITPTIPLWPSRISRK